MIQRMCRSCGSCYTQYNTLQNKCAKCTLKQAKPLKKQGKEAKKWQAFRKQWLKDNPPTGELYTCALCFKAIPKSELQLDHIEPQGWKHEGKYDPTNIQPTHALCNYMKGSKRVYEKSENP